MHKWTTNELEKTNKSRKSRAALLWMKALIQSKRYRV